MVFLTLFLLKIKYSKNYDLVPFALPFSDLHYPQLPFFVTVFRPTLPYRYLPLPTVTHRYRYERFFVVNLKVGKVKERLVTVEVSNGD